MPRLKFKERTAIWTNQAAEVVIPDEGMSLSSYSTLIRADPIETERAARYLHRQGIIWMSKRRGHVRIYPISKKPEPGRPVADALTDIVAVNPSMLALLADVLPTIYRVNLLHRDKPEWSSMQFRRLGEITEAIRVESANLVATVRIFAAAHPEIAIDDIRKTLWLVYPAMMAVAVETQEELQIGAPVAAPEAKTPKRVAKGLGDEERVLAYIERAGPNGIPAYDIVTKCAGKIDREQVERIGEMLEQSGLVFSEMVRPSFVGRKGLRFFSVKHGKPNITARGELVAR